MFRLIALLLAAAPAVAADPPAVEAGQPVTQVVDRYIELGYPFVYSSNLLRPGMVVVSEPTSGDPLAVVREILAPHGLAVREEASALLIVRQARQQSDNGSILLVITSGRSEHAVADARIDFEPGLAATGELKSGVWEYTGVAPGRYRLVIDAAGYAPADRFIDLWPGESKIINVRLTAERPEIETIAVSASRYEILRELAPSRFAIDQRTIETLPVIGDDPLRAIQRLPGAAAGGTSAETHLRGGALGEIGIWLNGQKLFDPFHVRDYQSIFSAIDSRAIEGVEVYTGGFPVRYGNRLSGMVLMESFEPPESRHHEIGISIFNTSLLTAGTEPGRSWLFSARRGNLDLVIDPEYGSPSYFDVFAEFTWDATPDMTLSWNALVANDRVEIVLESEPEELERVVSDTENAQVWMQIDNRWSETLSSKTVLSATWFDNLRRGSLGDEEKIVASVSDDRNVLQLGFRQDFLYRRSDRHLLQWGLQVRTSEAEYIYANEAEYFGLQSLFEGYDEPRSRNVAAAPEGSSYALFFSDRWRLTPRTSVEWGLRWDEQTYTDLESDSQLSPRLSLMQRLGERSEFRISWGRYYQAQEINELQVEDGIANFWPAQRADHVIAGFRHLFNERYALRVELFDKQIHDVQPRFENLFDPLGLIPEIQPDRVRLDPTSARSRGLEISLDRSAGPLEWWATYVLSEATDRIDGRDELRSWDQRHAFAGGFSYTTERWQWSLVGSVHSGWPLTELALVEDGVDEDGEPIFVAVPGPRNVGRHDTFASLDFRVARTWKFERGTLMAFLEVANLTNRKNPCCLDFDLEEDEQTGEEVFERGLDYWMPLLPAIGVRWQF